MLRNGCSALHGVNPNLKSNKKMQNFIFLNCISIGWVIVRYDSLKSKNCSKCLDYQKLQPEKLITLIY